MPTTLPIDLAPSPGFCVKSYTATESNLPNTPAGRKVFVNICYDKNVPPPPPADEDTIKRAINDEDPDDHSYYVPVVVSEPRQDKDKAGNPALIFDCVYNSSLRSRALRDSTFKIFLVELALQRIEAQTSLVLSRKIGTPNITAKGKLEPRRVWIPSWLAVGKDEHEHEQDQSKSDVNADEKGRGTGKGKGKGKGKKLIEEVDDGTGIPSLPKLKGILKQGGSTSTMSLITDVTPGLPSSVTNVTAATATQKVLMKPQRPTWRWKKDDERLKIIVDVPPKIPREVITKATLDIEPRRIILNIPASNKTPPFDLDIDLNKSDAEIVATSTLEPVMGVGLQVVQNDSEENAGEDLKMKEPNCTLLLKRQREFDVDLAEAGWKIEDGRLEIWV